MRPAIFLTAVYCVLLASGATAQDMSGPFKLPSGSFGSLGKGMVQSRASNELNVARDLGRFEDTVDMRSGWFLNMAKITGRLDIEVERKDSTGNWIAYACTATAISEDLILTNAHCIIHDGTETTRSVEFFPNFRDARTGDVVAGYLADIIPVEVGSQSDLDYAVLRLQKPIVNYQGPAFATRDVVAGEPLVVIGHPEAQPLSLSRGGCQSDHEFPVRGNDILHHCGTRQGSSGSLVFSLDGHVVGLHHSGGLQLTGRSVSRALRMSTLIAQSETLLALFGAGTAQQQSIIVDNQPLTAGASDMCLLAFNPLSDVLTAVDRLEIWRANRLFVDVATDKTSFLSIKELRSRYREVHWGRRGQAFGRIAEFYTNDGVTLADRLLTDMPGKFEQYLPREGVHRMYPAVAAVKISGGYEFWGALTMLRSATADDVIAALQKVEFLDETLQALQCLDANKVSYLVDAPQGLELDVAGYLDILKVAAP